MDTTHSRWRRLRRAYYFRAAGLVLLSASLLLFGLGFGGVTGIVAALGLAGLLHSSRQAPALRTSLERCLRRPPAGLAPPDLPIARSWLTTHNS
jgi:hypothetical protein